MEVGDYLIVVLLSLVVYLLLDKKVEQRASTHCKNAPAKRHSNAVRPQVRKPLTYATQRVQPFRQIGFLYSQDAKQEMMPLLGRQVHNGSTNWNYYTLTNH